ncbi:hypothetical protein CLF_103343 [Clonorchis sinensis]|uniref:Uncharacterized protein n=1 Tax=Clonorchis sinensis TaxID=79923 RepID=G7Y9K5_CLOSI|nr:hypothetical protein CLF_103343 [Clonorchis sinensis]
MSPRLVTTFATESPSSTNRIPVIVPSGIVLKTANKRIPVKGQTTLRTPLKRCRIRRWTVLDERQGQKRERERDGNTEILERLKAVEVNDACGIGVCMHPIIGKVGKQVRIRNLVKRLRYTKSNHTHEKSPNTKTKPAYPSQYPGGYTDPAQPGLPSRYPGTAEAPPNPYYYGYGTTSIDFSELLCTLLFLVSIPRINKSDHSRYVSLRTQTPFTENNRDFFGLEERSFHERTNRSHDQTITTILQFQILVRQNSNKVRLISQCDNQSFLKDVTWKFVMHLNRVRMLWGFSLALCRPDVSSGVFLLSRRNAHRPQSSKQQRCNGRSNRKSNGITIGRSRLLVSTSVPVRKRAIPSPSIKHKLLCNAVTERQNGARFALTGLFRLVRTKAGNHGFEVSLKLLAMSGLKRWTPDVLNERVVTTTSAYDGWARTCPRRIVEGDGRKCRSSNVNRQSEPHCRELPYPIPKRVMTKTVVYIVADVAIEK